MPVGFLLLPRFAAEVEARNMVSAVVAVHHRGRLLSLSAAAEQLGLRVGSRLREAQAVCPEAEFRPFVEDHCHAPWRQVLDLCATHVSGVEPVALGEVFLDLPSFHGSDGPSRILAEIRQTLEAQWRFSCLLGGGPNKLVARIAAEAEPGRVIAPHQAAAFLAPLAISHLERGASSLPEVRKRLPPPIWEQLRDLGLTTIGLLQQVSAARLMERFGREGRGLRELAHGIDRSAVQPLHPPRTISVRLSLPGGVGTAEALEACLRRLSARVAAELADRREACCRLTLRVEAEGAADVLRATHLRQPAATGEELLRLSRRLLTRLESTALVTALVLQASDFRRAGGRQLSLFSGAERPDAARRIRPPVFEALASVREHFGSEAALPAAEIELPRRERLLAVLSAGG